MTKQDMIDVIKIVMNYLYKDVGDTWYGDLLSDVLEELNNGDVETVVRCEDCEYYNGEYKYCVNDIFAKPNGYCSYGKKNERKNGQ